MEFFPDQLDLIYSAMWKRVHKTCLERGGGLTKKERKNLKGEQTSPSVRFHSTCKVNARLPTDARGNTWRASPPCGEPRCATVFNCTLAKANQEERKASSAVSARLQMRKCQGLIKVPTYQHPRCWCHGSQASSSFLFLSKSSLKIPPLPPLRKQIAN